MKLASLRNLGTLCVTLMLFACVVTPRNEAQQAWQHLLAQVCALDGNPPGAPCSEAPPDARRSIIELNPAGAELAAALDRQRRQSPLHGRTVLLKANIETGDAMQTTAGSLALAGFTATTDAALVQRLRAAGLLIAGKANLSEWANFRSSASVSGWSSAGGQTRHALDPARNPCGSSSGSAVAVALGLVPLSIGTETDGSIICPASINGIVGIKPTLGLVSRSGIIPLAHSQDTAGPMARTVSDAAALLSIIAGNDRLDPATRDIPKDVLPVQFDLDVDALKGKRIGVIRSFYGSGEYPAVEAVFAAALARLERAGATLVDPIALHTDGLGDAEYAVLLHEFKADLNDYLAARDTPIRSLAELIAWNTANAATVMPHFGQDILMAAQATEGLESQAYRDALAASKNIATTALLGAFTGHDLDALVVPSNGPAWPIDYENGDDFTVGSSSLAAVSGYPSITVPAGDADGLPLGVSFIGRAWRDAALIELAYAFEQAGRK